MVNDLVKFLRDDEALNPDKSQALLSGYAADEIERLRVALTAAAATSHGCSTGFFPCWCEEARRG